MIINKLNLIENEIQLKIDVNKHYPKIIAVSKTHEMNNILPLIEYGHKNFGENKVQEALLKWKDVKLEYPDIKLHMIGKIQTNKVKYVVELFDSEGDSINSLDYSSLLGAPIKGLHMVNTENDKLNALIVAQDGKAYFHERIVKEK